MTSENISGFQVPKSDFWRLTHTQTMKARVGIEIRPKSTKIHWFRFVHHDYQRDINGAEIWKDPEKTEKTDPTLWSTWSSSSATSTTREVI
jgi:hypothetical protein